MQQVPILKLIPQRPPFVMVGELIEYNETGFASTFSIDADNIFVKNGRFTEEGMLENIAQTAAAGAGYGFFIEQKEIKLGYIGALKNARILKLPAVHTSIRTEVKVLTKVLNVDIVEGKIFDANHNLLASCEMKIFIGE